MKATVTLLAAILASAFSFSAAKAQYPIQPVAFGGTASVGGGCADGSCGSSSCGCKGGCAKKHPFAFAKSKGGNCGADGCGNGCGHKCPLVDKLCSCLCRSLPSNAPSCHRPNYPLGFPNSPYVRSPRDYFMMDQYTGY